ncbi:uncharacterized protein FOBCDRAFT_48569 [Fusarium oxysporum Fo47]|uniref:uncharacterized protein n=1 Tax=Fusarium oxysporum Fo47 TaxID=660027 RepID=UPI002869A3FD|nr:uncharacterized protein FOBCDRAFT_48569 [Fusarium oxysporum Fo47]WJG36018.1 hypothetical protein FOBCDRAFT_48569 [Fusarium oxysporum Fo47]
MLRVCFSSLMLWRISGSRVRDDPIAVVGQHTSGCFISRRGYARKGGGNDGKKRHDDHVATVIYIRTTRGGWRRWCSGHLRLNFISDSMRQNAKGNGTKWNGMIWNEMVFSVHSDSLAFRYTWTASRHAFAPLLALDVAHSLNADESHHVAIG